MCFGFWVHLLWVLSPSALGSESNCFGFWESMCFGLWVPLLWVLCHSASPLQREGSDHSTPPWACQAQLCPALSPELGGTQTDWRGSQGAPQRWSRTGEPPDEGYPLWGEEKAQGQYHHSIPELQRLHKEDRSSFLTRSHRKKTKGIRHQLDWNRFYFLTKFFFVSLRTVIQWNSLPRDMVESESMEVFWDEIEIPCEKRARAGLQNCSLGEKVLKGKVKWAIFVSANTGMTELLDLLTELYYIFLLL